MKKKLLLFFILLSYLSGVAQTTTTQTTGGNVSSGSITMVRQTMGNANATYSVTTTQVALTATISATRTLTLPLANSVTAGKELSFIDEIGTITSTNNIQIKRAGSNTINGDTMLVFSSPYSFPKFVSDGSSKWTSAPGLTASSGTWTPTFTGFSVPPTVDNNEYSYIVLPDGKKQCTVSFNSYGGTQNSTGFTMTLPFAAKKYTVFVNMALDNATGLYARGIINAGSNIITFYSSPSGSGAWGGVGGKWAGFNLTYFVQ